MTGGKDEQEQSSRLGGVVLMKSADYLEYLEQLRWPRRLPEQDTVTSSVTRTVAGDSVIYVTARATQAGPGLLVATTMSMISLAVDIDAPSNTNVMLLVALEPPPSHAPTKDFLRAAGMTSGAARDLVTSMAARTRDPMNFPQFPWEIEHWLDKWTERHVPSLAVLARTDQTRGTTIRAAEAGIPWAMRSAVSLIGINSRVAKEFDDFLAKHDIEPLRSETISVLRLTPSGLVEVHRTQITPKQASAKLESKRLATLIENGLRGVATDLVRYLPEVALAGMGVDSPAELDAVSAELVAARAEAARTHASLERTRAALTETRSRLRDVEHALSAARAKSEPPAKHPRAEDHPAEQAAVPLADVPESAVEPERSFATFGELLAAAREELDLVEIGAVDAEASALDAHGKARIWRAKTWRTLVMLQRFAEARAAGSSAAFRAWLNDLAHPLISPESVVPDETTPTATSPGLRAARVFPVPTDVSPDGRGYFGAHVRIEPGRTSPAPRLHYLDDCASTGKIYVGHLGRHLPVLRGR